MGLTEENIGWMLQDIGLGGDFFNKIPKVQMRKARLN